MVSIGIDATIRQWSLFPDELRNAVDRAKAKSAGVEEEEEKPNTGPVLTEEEERELAELMDE